MEIALIFGSLILLVLIGVPVAFSMGLSTLLGFYLNNTWGFASVIAQRMYSGSTSFILIAIPFYIMTGLLMNAGGMTKRIICFAQLLVGRFTGGMGYVNVVASMIFSGMSGSAVADASGLGILELEVMKKAGYEEKFSAAITAASSTIGPIVPPSIPFVIYGGLTGTSVGRLFLGGFIPGIAMGISLIIAIYFVARKRNFPKNSVKMTWKEFATSTVNVLLALGTVLIIVYGIVGGVFTPTEAAVVASIYSFVLGFFFYKDLKLQQLPGIVWETLKHTIRVIFIIATASGFSWVLTIMHVPQKIIATFSSILSEPILVLLIINALLLILGCFMESISIMLLVTPVLMPVIKEIGMDPVHFGVMMTLNLMIGLITPPMGLSLYSVASISKIPIWNIVSELKPFLIALLAVLLLIIFFPSLTMFLPDLIMGN